jgi:REase_AHJR-like
MNNMIQSLYEKKIQSAAQELLANGYQVSIDPLPSDLPFELGGYSPNLIATKDDKGIILEIKASLKRLSVDRFQDIAGRVSTHPGWRFLLVTLDDTSEKILSSSADGLPSWEELNISLGKLNTLIQDSFLEPAFLYLWSILESALRKRALTQNIPISRFPTKELLNHTFSSGEISISDFDLFTSYLDVRNRIAHGIVVPIDSEILKLAQSSVKILVGKWSKETS